MLLLFSYNRVKFAFKVVAALMCRKKLQNFIKKGSKRLQEQPQLQAASSLFSLASVPLINSWLSSVTNVSLPSSSPGEEGGVFNVQFVLWIDVCWHRLSPAARTVRSHRSTAGKEKKKASFFFLLLRGLPTQMIQRRRQPAGLTDTRRSAFAALMDGSGW